jgi:hypothetical protein
MDGGAMGRTTHHHLTHARRVFDRADRKFNSLEQELWRLHGRSESAEKLERVEELFTEWLVNMRQVFVSINRAASVGGMDPQFKEWWDDVARDPRHDFFRRARNDGFKEGDQVVREEWIGDPEIGEPSYFVLIGNAALDGDPMLARCHQYLEWTYREVLSEANIRLFDRFREDAAAEAATSTHLF